MSERTERQLRLEDWAVLRVAMPKPLPAAAMPRYQEKGKGELWKKLSKHDLYSTWRGMKDRCENPKNKDYHNYGGRGIRVCERWRSFAAFVEDMNPRPKGHTIDRVENNGPYSPENCVWATPFQQMQHTRWGRYLTFNGESLTIAQWARKLNVKHEFIKLRLRRGWSVADALTLPADKYPASWRRKFTDDEIAQIRASKLNGAELAKLFSVNRSTINKARAGKSYNKLVLRKTAS